MIGKLNHVGVATPSIEQSVAMYRDVLGATKIGETSLGRTCDVSKDGGWVVTGTTIVDLEEAAFTQLTRVDSKGSYIRGEPIFPDRSARSPRVVAGG